MNILKPPFRVTKISHFILKPRRKD